MPCCGQKRQALQQRPPSHEVLPTGADAVPLVSSVPDNAVYFEYFGPTAMTVIGGGTGRTYRFGWPGARVAVQPEDQRSLADVPNLRMVR